MRPAAAIAVVTLLLVISGSGTTVARYGSLPGPRELSAPVGLPGTAGRGPEPLVPAAAPAARLPFLGLPNATLPVADASSAYPDSAYQETPLPSLPPTTPTVFTGASAVAPAACCVYIDFTAPLGPFGAIVLNYTGTAENTPSSVVYDSSYRAYVDGVQVLEGTTPEFGTWTVQKDLTEYASLFVGAVNVSFLLGSAISGTGAHFVSNASISFYPVAPGTSPPPAPSEIIPLWAWNDTYLHSPTAEIFANATVPENATNATLELFVYGFGTTDEFWYAAQPGYREAEIDLDGQPLAGVLPFPYLNTGGIDLFLWRPLPASFTLSDRPYEIDLSGSLGRIEGTHEFTATVSGFTSGSTWLVGGSLQIYTSPSAGRATQTEVRVTGGTPTTSSGSTSSDANESREIRTASTYLLNGTLVNESTIDLESMVNDQALKSSGSSTNFQQWTNVSMTESMGTTTWRNVSGTTTTTVRSLEFPFTFDEMIHVLQVGTSGSSTIDNVTLSVEAFHQEWREVDATGAGLDPMEDGAVSSVDDLTAASGYWTYQEEVASDGSGSIVEIFPNLDSSTSKSYSYASLGTPLPASYLHVLDGAGYDPPGPNEVETVLANTVSEPLVAAAFGGARSLDVGTPLTLSVRAAGGSGDYSYEWSDLPTGCVALSAPTLPCTPTGSGAFDPSVVVRDGSGNATTASAGAVDVYPALSVAVAPAYPSFDNGQNATFTAVVAGGDPLDESCQWANGTYGDAVPIGGPQPCNATAGIPVSASAPPTIFVTVTDGTGETAVSVPFSVPVAAFPVAHVVLTSSNATAHPGGFAGAEVTVDGGSAPFDYQWAVNGTNVTGATGSSYLFSPAGVANYTLSAWVTDAANETVRAGSVAIKVTPASATNRSSTSTVTGSSGSTDDTGWYVAIALAAVVGVLGFLLYRSPRQPPAPVRPPNRAPPRSGGSPPGPARRPTGSQPPRGAAPGRPPAAPPG